MQPSTTTARQRAPERSFTWPPAASASTDQRNLLHKTFTYPQANLPASASSQARGATRLQPSHGSTPTSYEDSLHHNPASHFLSPIQMYEYEYDYDDGSYDSDSEDDDGEQVEWDAGITDFALFNDERRQAEGSGEPLPSKWSELVQRQADAMQRAVARNREGGEGGAWRPLIAREGIPGLTPDASPEMRDDHSESSTGSDDGESANTRILPDYLDGNSNGAGHKNLVFSTDEYDDDDLLSPHFATRQQKLALARRGLEQRNAFKVQRPGMRHSRTMSGQVHAWRRPSWGIYTVGEAEEDESREDDEETGMGRARS